MKLLVRLVALAGAFAAFGCATLNNVGGIAVNLVSVLPHEVSLFETAAAVTLRYTNEQNVPLELAGSTHKIYLNGTYVGRAVSSEKVILPRFGTATQVVVAHLENLTLMRKAQELGNVPNVDYRIDSRLHTVDDRHTFAAAATGQLDLRGLLPVTGELE